MSNDLKKAVRQIGTSFEKVENLYFGDLGIVKNNKKQVKVPGRKGFVYVRLRSVRSELVEAQNDKVEEKYGVPVVLKREGNRYAVVKVNRERYSTWDTDDAYIPQHARTHTFDKDGNVLGGDGVFISSYQFLPYLLCPFPNNATNAFIYPYVDRYDNEWVYYGGTGTVSFTPYKPASGTSLVLVSIDYDTGNPHYISTTGTFVPLNVTGISQVLPYAPDIESVTGSITPIGLVRLTSETQEITWSNIYDLRPHFGGSEAAATGSSVFVGDPNRVAITDGTTGELKTSDELTFNEADDSLVIGDTTGSGDGDGSYLHAFAGDKAHAGDISTSHQLITYDGGAARSSYVKLITSLGTKASPILVATNTVLGRYRFGGYDGDAKVSLSATSAEVKGVASEAFDASGHGTDVVISATPTNSTTIQDVAKFAGDGKLSLPKYGVGTFTGTAAKSLEVDSSGVIIESDVRTLDSGTWTPTLTNVTNVDASVGGACHYIRIGDNVMCWGLLQIDATVAASAVVVRMSLPIASNFSDTSDASGNLTSPGVTPSVGSVIPNTTYNTFEIRVTPANAGNIYYRFAAGYIIIS